MKPNITNKTQRQLAAIMFSDIAGYTSLMQKNEQMAREFRQKYKQTAEAAVSSHGGRILQFYGDGSLSVFNSTIEAVKCAVKIQKEMLTEPKIDLRVGLHMGDILYDDEAVYGDSVNIASRLESLSVPGSVFISEKIHDEIKNHPDLQAVSLGTFELKNVKKPLEVYAIHSDGLTVPKREEVKGKLKENAGTIAVLPFVNMSADPENDYFSDGITEELLNALTRIEGLYVTARTSSFAYKGTNKDIKEIGRELSVSKIIEGSVRRLGNKIRVTAQLIDTQNGYHEWSEVFTRESGDLFELQDEISLAIVNKFKQELPGIKITQPPLESTTDNEEAYNLYLKALYHSKKPDNIRTAIKMLEDVILLAPKFAKAYSLLADCYVSLGRFGWMKIDVTYPRAKEYANRALELDDKIAESHLSIAYVKRVLDWDWKGANYHYQTALNLNHGSAEVHKSYSQFLIQTCKPQEALEEARIAYSLDPMSLDTLYTLSSSYLMLGKADESLKLLNRGLEIDADNPLILGALGFVQIELGNTQKAVELFMSANELAGNYSTDGQIGYAYARAGMPDKALEYLEKMEQADKESGTMKAIFDYIAVYGSLGNYDKMLDYMGKALEQRMTLSYFFNIPFFREKLGKDKRFLELKRRMGLLETN